jgi:predicted permease
MGSFWQDVRYGVRMLLKNPGFSVVAVITLALGIGANTAIFSVVNGVLLRPLPYPAAGQLVQVFTVMPTQPRFPMAIADFKDYMDQNKVFSSGALYAERDLDLTVSDTPLHLSGMGVSQMYFQVLGYHPALGRDFGQKEDYKGNNHVVILSDRLWRTRFGSDPNIIGKGIILSDESFTVIGVMPPGVQHVGGVYRSTAQGDTVDAWWPLALWPSKPDECDRGCHFLNMVARLKPGVSAQQANADMNSIAANLAKLYPDSDKNNRILIVPLKEEIVGQARLMLYVLLGSVGFLLLIACVNVANLSLARATSRQREIALRSVLGAGGFRIVRQLLTESLLLASAGCALGLLFAGWGVAALVALSPENLPRLQSVKVDASVLIFAALITILTALLFGLAPALTILREDVNKALKDGDRGTTASAGRGRLRDWLVTAEIALALVLLAGGGLLMRTFLNLQRVSAGFEPAHVLTFHTDLPGKRYADSASFVRFYKNLADRLQALPGVQAVGVSSDIPWTGYDENSSFDIEGRPANPNESVEARYHFVSPDYFRTMGIPLVRGRFYSLSDDDKSPKVIVVNSALAEKYFPGQDAVGKHLELWGNKGVAIIGIVGDVKDTPDGSQAKPAFYFLDAQVTDRSDRTVVIRAQSNLSTLTGEVRREVLAIDKDLPITNVVPMDEIGTHAVSNARFTMLLVGSFAGLALLLAAVGIFGVMSYSVTQRMHEFGIRMALGAQQENVLGMVVSQGARLAAAGVAIGLVAAMVLTRAMATLLYGVSASDPWTFAGVAVVLVAVALFACYLPARRASRVDPMVALRYE